MTQAETPTRPGSRVKKLLAVAAQNITTETLDALNDIDHGINKAGIAGVTAVREGAGTVTLYDRQGNRRHIPAQVLGVVLKEAGGDMFDVCPLCHGEHDSDSPNACPAKPPRKYRVCPVCNKKCYDPAPEGHGFKADPDDPNAIADEAPAGNTPEERTQAALIAHMSAFHRIEAIARGYPDRDANTQF